MTKQNIMAGVLALALIAMISWLVFYFTGLFGSANPSVQAAIIAGGVGLLSIIFTIWNERSKYIRELHREKKIEIYNNFYDLWFSLADDLNEGRTVEERAADPDFINNMRRLTRGYVFYGSPKVIIALADFNFKRNVTEGDPVSALRSFGRVLLAMRKDIGLSNFGLDELSVQQPFVSDDLSKGVVRK